MKANELMIGDWVKTPVDMGKIQAINATCLPNFQTVEVWHKRYEDGRRAGDYICDSLDLRPIPLTPEILKKNGWINTAPGIWQITIGNMGLLWQDSNKLFQMIEHTPYEEIGSRDIDFRISARFCISDVHELQHALRLCGIEKEIEL